MDSSVLGILVLIAIIGTLHDIVLSIRRILFNDEKGYETH